MSVRYNPTFSVVLPVYGAERTVAETIQSVLDQTFQDFEIVIVDDGCRDASIEICKAFRDRRIRIVTQENRGLSGARNTGIREARGEFIALVDADDTWKPGKLERHYIHLMASPHVGISYSGSDFIDDLSRPMRMQQIPRLRGIKAHHIFLRNPIGNGSAPIFRRQVFEDIAFKDPHHGETAYFDESFRQSEDVECWIRIALTTDWVFQGLPGTDTNYRINMTGLSANVEPQLETWERMAEKVRMIDSKFHRRWAPIARAYQRRYLSRRSVHNGDGYRALHYFMEAMTSAPRIIVTEPKRSVVTLAAAVFLTVTPAIISQRLWGLIFKPQAAT